MLANAELDPGADPAVDGGLMPFIKVLHDELCKEGPGHCPTLLYAKGHSHMSIVFSIDSPGQNGFRADSRVDEEDQVTIGAELQPAPLAAAGRGSPHMSS